MVQKMKIETWFRISLVATFFLNMAGTLVFLPPFRGLREFGGLPEAENSLYAWTIAIWIFFFGIGYLWLAFSKTRQRLFVLTGALGKSSFAILLAVLAAIGELPTRAAFAGLADLFIAAIFFVWLLKTRTEVQ